MGHVDHGKTTLLDTLRKYNHNGGAVNAASSSSSSKKRDKKSKAADGPTEVAGTEAGGITQKLSAFGVSVSEGRRLMFLDTPGHAAFTAMRSHGATATDLVILVVAIDDGVRPQTVEALKMAKDAGCSIIVALNKIDRIPATEREAARGRVLSQLMSHQLVAEEYGGDVQVVEVAGRTGEGIPELMESLLLQAEVLELKAAFEGRAEAVVLDASLEKGKGVVAEVLVRWGSLNVGDAIVVGGSYGKVKSMINDRGETVRTALPSDAVRLLGLRELPVSGQEMLGVESEDAAREVAERRMAEVEAKRVREQDLVRKRLEMKARMEAAAAAEASGDAEAKAKAAAALAAKPIKIDVVIKADGVGTLQALERIVQGVASRTLKGVVVDVVHSAVGEVTNSDLDLASAGEDALILAFNVGVVDGDTRSRAKLLDINICRSDIIYRLEDELVKAILDHLPKERSLVKEVSFVLHYTFTCLETDPCVSVCSWPLL
jgi:translation initiation factor IF-2